MKHCFRPFLLIAAMLWPLSVVRAETVTVFAAASLKPVLDKAAEHWQRDTGNTLRLSYAASSILARQIEAGAPADIFISANQAWMGYLADRGLIVPETRADIAGNNLVLISHAKVARQENIPDILPLLAGQRLAIALVEAVPAGIYGKSALEHVGQWDALRDHLAQTDNVRAALTLVARGELPFGVVYASDAAAAAVSSIAQFPSESHEPIRYPLAKVAASKSKSSEGFIAYLQGADFQTLLTKHGFEVLQ